MLKKDILPFLDSLKTRQITNRDLAKQLHVTEAHLSRTLKDLGFQKNERQPDPFKIKQKAHLATRKAVRSKAASNKILSIEEAAKQAGCSTRTIYRLRSK